MIKNEYYGVKRCMDGKNTKNKITGRNHQAHIPDFPMSDGHDPDGSSVGLKNNN